MQVYIVAQIWNDSVVPLFSLLHKRNPSLSDVEERLNITLLLSTRYKVVTMRHITWKLCGVITWCGAVFAAWSIMWWQFCGESWIVQYVTCTNVEKNFEKLCSMENHNVSQWVFLKNMMFHTLWQLIFVFGGGQYYAIWNVCLFIKFWRFSFRSRNLDFVFNISISFYVLWKFNDDILHIMHACIDTGVRKGPYNPGIFQFQNFVPPPPLSQKTIVKLSLCIWILKIFLDSHPHP